MNLLKSSTYLFTLSLCGLILFVFMGFSNLYATQNQKTMENPKNILIHLSQGPENPTVAALAFLIAKTAVEEGHQVTLFLAGDAVQLMRDGVMDNLTGLGTGKIKEHYEVLADAGCMFYLSGMSSKSRGLAREELQGKKVEFASPKKLLNLAIEHDRAFVY